MRRMQVVLLLLSMLTAAPAMAQSQGLSTIVGTVGEVLGLVGMGTSAVGQMQTTRQMLRPAPQVQQPLCQPPLQPQFLDPSNDPQRGYVCVQPGQNVTVGQR